jgi:hypothetical protein
VLCFASAQAPAQPPKVGDTELSPNQHPFVGRTSPTPIAIDSQRRLCFERNHGQASSSEVKYLAHNARYEIALTPDEAVLALPTSNLHSGPADSRSTDVIHLRLVGAKSDADIRAEEPQRGRVNYLIGNDPTKWQTNLPTYGRIRYTGVYPGVDLVYYGNQDHLEYDFVVSPEARTRKIRLHFDGAERLRLDNHGDLEIQSANGEILFEKPLLYQVLKGRREPVRGSFRLQPDNTVGFNLGVYDHHLPLVIDPVLAYSTYLGGSTGDYANAIAVDSAGSVYVAGYALSSDFPTTGSAYQKTNKGSSNTASNVFVTKFTPDGSGLVYSTYLGGSGKADSIAAGPQYGDVAYGLALDSAGSAYITGSTYSSDYWNGPPQASPDGLSWLA